MTVTVLAIIFLLLMLIIAYAGFRFLGGVGGGETRAATESCSLCRNRLPKAQLIERTAANSRVYRFCAQCIRSLTAELTQRN